MRYVFNPFLGNFDAVDLPSGVKFVKNGYTLELWFLGTKVQEWIVTPAEVVTGNPIGLLLALTYTIE